MVIGASKTNWDEKSTEIKLDAPCEGPIGEIMFMLDFFLRERAPEISNNPAIIPPLTTSPILINRSSRMIFSFTSPFFSERNYHHNSFYSWKGVFR